MQTLLLAVALQLGTPSFAQQEPEPESVVLAQAATDSEDDPEISKQVDQDSAELEEMRALEEVALDPGAQSSAEVLQSLERLGYANPLRQRMKCALNESALRDDLAGELGVITNLAAFDVSTVEGRYDIPVEMQPLVSQYIHFFQTTGRKWFVRWMDRSTRYIPKMQEILEQKGMPKDTVYLAMIESGFSEHAYSWANASGPWQFIASTGKQYGLKQDFWIDERRDPVKATHAAASYLRQLYKELGHWYLAWAGYNAGGGKVRKMISRTGSKDFWALCEEERGFAKETKHYVPKLIAAALVAKHPKAFGFQDTEFQFLQPFDYQEVPVTDATDLEVIARAAGASVEQIQELNPELKRWCTPPASSKKPYSLRVPRAGAPTFAENLAKIPASERLTFKVHRVRKGDTLSKIASTYGSAAEAVMKMNTLRSAKALRVNSELIIPVPRGAKNEGPLARHVAQAQKAGYVPARAEEEIPAGTQTKPAVASGTVKTETVDGKTKVTYGIASGDSLWTISQRFSVTVDDLRKWNNLTRKARLSIGKALTIWPNAKSALLVR
ncbi:MAG: LysM peptidoglycan-binding domain-containing protein [Myxococcaceae bacterium]